MPRLTVEKVHEQQSLSLLAGANSLSIVLIAQLRRDLSLNATLAFSYTTRRSTHFCEFSHPYLSQHICQTKHKKPRRERPLTIMAGWTVFERMLLHILFSHYKLDFYRPTWWAIYNDITNTPRSMRTCREDYKYSHGKDRTQMYSKRILKNYDDYDNVERKEYDRAFRIITQTAKSLGIGLPHVDDGEMDEKENEEALEGDEEDEVEDMDEDEDEDVDDDEEEDEDAMQDDGEQGERISEERNDTSRDMSGVQSAGESANKSVHENSQKRRRQHLVESDDDGSEECGLKSDQKIEDESEEDEDDVEMKNAAPEEDSDAEMDDDASDKMSAAEDSEQATTAKLAIIAKPATTAKIAHPGAGARILLAAPSKLIAELSALEGLKPQRGRPFKRDAEWRKKVASILDELAAIHEEMQSGFGLHAANATRIAELARQVAQVKQEQLQARLARANTAEPEQEKNQQDRGQSTPVKQESHQQEKRKQHPSHDARIVSKQREPVREVSTQAQPVQRDSDVAHVKRTEAVATPMKEFQESRQIHGGRTNKGMQREHHVSKSKNDEFIEAPTEGEWLRPAKKLRTAVKPNPAAVEQDKKPAGDQQSAIIMSRRRTPMRPRPVVSQRGASQDQTPSRVQGSSIAVDADISPALVNNDHLSIRPSAEHAEAYDLWWRTNLDRILFEEPYDLFPKPPKIPGYRLPVDTPLPSNERIMNFFSDMFNGKISNKRISSVLESQPAGNKPGRQIERIFRTLNNEASELGIHPRYQLAEVFISELSPFRNFRLATAAFKRGLQMLHMGDLDYTGLSNLQLVACARTIQRHPTSDDIQFIDQEDTIFKLGGRVHKLWIRQQECPILGTTPRYNSAHVCIDVMICQEADCPKCSGKDDGQKESLTSLPRVHRRNIDGKDTFVAPRLMLTREHEKDEVFLVDLRRGVRSVKFWDGGEQQVVVCERTDCEGCTEAAGKHPAVKDDKKK
jgi:hypothetical protein